MSCTYCCIQTAAEYIPRYTYNKRTQASGSCKSQGEVGQGWPNNTQCLGADISMIITVPKMLALRPVLCTLNGLVWSFFTFVSSTPNADAAAGSRRCTEGTKDVWIRKVKKVFLLHTGVLAQPTSPCLRSSAAGHHFIAFTTEEVLKVRAQSQAQSSEESCMVPLPWWLNIRKARRKRI